MRATPLLLTTALAATVLGTAAPAAAASPARPHDFNGDGRTDLVVNGPELDQRGHSDTGVVAIRYGGSGRKQLLTQHSPGMGSVPEHGVGFGEATASADFDRDGYADLAVTGPNEHGATVVYGSAKGLSGRVAFLETGERRGPLPRRLAVGDFDRDGRADLVMTSTTKYWVFSRVDDGTDVAEPVRHAFVSYEIPLNDLRPAVGDFTGDGRDDIFLSSSMNPHFTRLVRATASGFAAPAAVPGLRQVRTAVVGDFNGDGRDDLVTRRAGKIYVRPGTRSGLGGARLVKKISSGDPVPLAAADVNRDGRDDLAAGFPEAGPRGSGQVVLIYGSRSGPTARKARVLHQRTKGFKAGAEKGDAFGSAVRLVDVVGDRRPDLVIGSSGEDRGVGRLYILTNRGRTISTKGIRQYGPGSFGLKGRRLGSHLFS
ncbi:FG-GAP repeat domain-containing protein [Actinocorallia populi]|uniref:FG-GAP repeat domain-containing protein n=1 Tax=Actinocorallia populi TaxID=2079200 RepID=UPI000D087068|nr:FG-GAP and VCBS repeat-containing protein [Actinocorallia populi]